MNVQVGIFLKKKKLYTFCRWPSQDDFADRTEATNFLSKTPKTCSWLSSHKFLVSPDFASHKFHKIFGRVSLSAHSSGEGHT